MGFNEEVIFKPREMVARLYSNGEITPVTMEFYKEFIAINNFQEDLLPPFIRIYNPPILSELGRERPSRVTFTYSGRPEEIYIEVSEDKVDWNPLDDETLTEELQIYFLFYPPFLRANFKTDPIKKELKGGFYTIEGKYKISGIQLPKRLHDLFKEIGISERWAQFHVRGDNLISMNQLDLPPSSDIITLEFNESETFRVM